VIANYFFTSGLQRFQTLLYNSVPSVLHTQGLYHVNHLCSETCVGCIVVTKSTLLLTVVKNGRNTDIKTVLFLVALGCSSVPINFFFKLSGMYFTACSSPYTTHLTFGMVHNTEHSWHLIFVTEISSSSILVEGCKRKFICGKH
jgi:hypothetical protein